MAILDYTSRSLKGAFRLLRGDPQGLRDLDLTVAGFWISFLTIVLVLPFQAVLIMGERETAIATSAHSPDTFPTGALTVARLAGFVLHWIDYPIVIALLAPLLGFTRRYVPFIVALNWVAPIVMVPAILPSLLMSLGIIGVEAELMLSLVVMLALIWLQYVVTRVTLMTSVAISIGLVVLDIAVLLAADAMLDRLAGV
ncbi:hypothetical protein [Methylobrevis albus]|uniref:Yip1 domain-containing protein n=1 Tax=Methylobrevis albus TaxID=2793297 RepID=A0A931I0I6_9HYPH|nr:hypothetical protein [Methylobrevis albus]MBH0237492.1 hypothetical protein [Methylobrevis albus]